MTQAEFMNNIKIIKKNGEKRLIYAIVYEPRKTDAHGDWASADEIEKACHNFMKFHQNIGVMHQSMPKELHLVECWIAPVPFDWKGEHVTKGSWIITIFCESEAIWNHVKKGRLTGVSMRGVADTDE